MKRIVLFILIVILLTGCWTGMEKGWYNITNFILPDDYEFLALKEELYMPVLIIEYMRHNFEYKYSIYAKSPYQLWKIKEGDCNDFSLFFTFIAHWNGFDTWQIRITFDDSNINHWLGVWACIEQNETIYNYTTNQYYGGAGTSFEAIVIHYCESNNRSWKKYEVFDFDMNIVIVEEKTQP